jgi:ABC-type transport system substrate-binding protein
VACSYRPSLSEDFVSVLLPDSYSPSDARRIASRFAPIPSIPLYVSIYLLQSPEYAVVTGIASDLRKAGIPVRIVVTNVSGAILFQNADHGGLVYINRTSSIDEQNVFWNPVIYPAEMTNLTAKMNATLYDERKLEISKRLQTLWAAELPVIPLTFGVHRSVFRSDLAGWNPEAVPDNMWWNVESWVIR